MHTPFSLLPRAAVTGLRLSKIREVANAGMGRDNVLPFWFGEPDEVTPAFIRDAASQSLAAGETFYSHNLGLPALRETLAAYLTSLHAKPILSAQIAVVSSGVNALMLAAQAIVSPGDKVVCVTPLWPNLVEIPKILSAQVTCVPLNFSALGWQLDVAALLSALTPDVKLVMINSPNNPTGWTITREDQVAILAHCRKHGIWILCDDAYERLVFDPALKSAPSFLALATDQDRIVCANTFSKSWLMTGWRLGWLVAPPQFIEELGKLIEYNTSCAPVFVQRAGIAAVREGERVITRTRTRFAAARDRLCAGLNALPGITAPPAPGAMYAFFKVEGLQDSLALCKRLVLEADLGLAPGVAFGPEGEGFIRWCFASELPRLDDGLGRFSDFMRKL
jgi:aspartate/methionine/tyrosine aminotransferase